MVKSSLFPKNTFPLMTPFFFHSTVTMSRPIAPSLGDLPSQIQSILGLFRSPSHIPVTHASVTTMVTMVTARTRVPARWPDRGVMLAAAGAWVGWVGSDGVSDCPVRARASVHVLFVLSLCPFLRSRALRDSVSPQTCIPARPSRPSSSPPHPRTPSASPSNVHSLLSSFFLSGSTAFLV
ncbi:hypothetical protein GY45DRAFT_460879 [Cubamyces sp. BRFM 1775]|nr:hypothetical protein GY45DRAFT_460879 [Cubamyces sp. BRFM 1775]